jgi:tRNA A-37 threonylcarbamoyl transferase component Bud32
MDDENTSLPPRYRHVALVGRGGMGEIYRAEDELLGRHVAVKLLAERYAQDEGVRGRFTREALAAARLSGEPNVVTIFDVGDWNGRPYIVMELLAGGSLAERLDAEGAQPPARVLRWLGEAAAALDAAHRHDVVHRDVKPANLLLDKADHVHVADFGIASAAGLDSFTAVGTVLGTAGYLSPEQARGERATPASDRYALGVVAYELLTGRRPYESASPTAEAFAHVNAPVPSVHEANRTLPRELDRVLAHALAKEPGERYPSAAELVAALREALDAAAGHTTVGALPPLTRRAHTSRRPIPLVAAGLAALALTGVVLATLAFSDGGGTTKAAAPAKVTVTAEGTTVVQTVTTAPPETTEPAPSADPSALNDQGYQLMREGNFDAALPLLEEAVAGLQGSGELTEAYAAYNLAFTRLATGSCDGVEGLLDRSAEIQGERKAISRLRKEARRGCDGGGGGDWTNDDD